jgi:hypothetical protein
VVAHTYPSTWEAETGGPKVQNQPLCETLSQKQTSKKSAGESGSLVEHLPSMDKALAKKKKIQGTVLELSFKCYPVFKSKLFFKGT